MFVRVSAEYMLQQIDLDLFPIQIRMLIINLERIVKYIQNIKINKGIETDKDISDKKETIIVNEDTAVLVYRHIHKLYIHTSEGMEEVRKLYEKGAFGKCQRAYCDSQYVLPYGEHEEVGKSNLKVYCPCCKDVYEPRNKSLDLVDGAYFGSSFAHLFELSYPSLFTKPKQEFIGTLFGFRMHKSSGNHPSKMEFNYKTGKTEEVELSSVKFANPDNVKRMAKNLIENIEESLTV